VLSIGRWHCQYLVPARHPDPEAVRWRLDAAMRAELEPCLAHVLRSVTDDADASLWFIRRLAVETSVGGQWSRDVAAALRRVIDAGGDGMDVVRFANRAAYLAAFLEDLAAGRAWSRWYYELAFASLRSLGTATAVREAIVREPPEIAAAALVVLARRGAVEPVLAMLGERDSAIVLDALCADIVPPRTCAVDVREEVEHMLATWPTLAAAAAVDSSPNASLARSTLRVLIARWVAEAAIAGAPAARRAIEWILTFTDEVTRASDRTERLALIASGRAELPGLGLTRADIGWLHWVASVVAPCTRAASSRQSAACYETALGGLYLLLPSALTVGLAELPAIRRAVLLAALADPRARTLGRADEVVSRLCPPHDPVDAGSIADQWRATMRFDARWIVAQSALGHVVLRDIVGDTWLAVEPDAPGAIERAVAHVIAATGREPLWVGRGDAPVPTTAEQDAVWREWLRRARPLAEEMRSLMQTGSPVDLTVMLVARATLGAFSRRLLGFAWSSAAYLYRNCLAVAAHVVEDADETVVQLTRAPLDPVLRMAGVDGQRYAVPWLGERTIRLVLPPR